MITDAFRSRVLAAYDASPTQIEELLAYNHNTFDHRGLALPLTFPLTPEFHVSAWDAYALEASTIGTFKALQKRLVQLWFPIREGISQSEPYRAATRRGVAADKIAEATGLTLTFPDQLQLRMHHSIVGRIPVLIPGCREDFVRLIQAFTMRNEPLPVPTSMGACTVGGYNNWDRIWALRQDWEATRTFTGEDWNQAFERIRAQKELYQDRFMIVSDGPYSNVSAADLGLLPDEWQRLSFTIRLEHECTHYFTHRIFGSMRDHAMDELIADYFGMVMAVGCFRLDWFLHFMGLEAFPAYREGGRLQNYRGRPPLSDDAFSILQQLVKDAAENLGQFDHVHADTLRREAEAGHMLLALTSLTLEELASPQGGFRLYGAWQAVRQNGLSSDDPN